jgi:hypothetical protein
LKTSTVELNIFRRIASLDRLVNHVAGSRRRIASLNRLVNHVAGSRRWIASSITLLDRVIESPRQSRRLFEETLAAEEAPFDLV